ncbi:matrin-3 isoform X2 [Nematolebias whitei]|uniref:matrin-3 isoform X2 n=1 Tax=Nematolebias whitei TaxID=451745 RepID=UPI0018977527|nr:matrin-3 isoform X2 [Nematolebias whitei]
MSQNYPYRQAPADPDPQSDPRHYSSAASEDFYRRPQESFSSSSRSLAAPHPTQGPQDSVLSLLASCGLEPGDLAVLAKLPEDVLTIESLPHLIKQMKGKKGTVKPFPARPPTPPPSSSSSRSFSSTHRPSASPASLDWDKLRQQPVQYPLHLIPPAAPQLETRSDRWGAHSSVRSSSSSVRPVQDTDLRPRLANYGKAASSCSSVELNRSRPPRFLETGKTDYRSVPPLDERPRSSGLPSADPVPVPVPSKQQALDFHGSVPSMYPYSCALCDITVLSEKAWQDHVNKSIHADGQLKLLQQFPNWDCRVKSSSRNEDQSHKRMSGASSAPSTQRTGQSYVGRPNKKITKPSDKGRVVCVKFPAQSVDEAYLQKCIEPFGKMGKILMFPSVAFVELGTADQAKDLVKFYSNMDPAENKYQLELSISNTFSFLQSSQVVGFLPAPSGKDGRSDLISIAKRFGEPLYCLFLPSKAFIEMKLPGDAKKLVDYYSSNVLKINNDTIDVSFSTEYKSLMRVTLATRCDEEPNQTTTSSTRESSKERKTRSRSRDRFKTTRRSRNRSRSRDRRRDRSKGRSSREKQSRDRSRDKSRDKSRDRSRDRSKREGRTKTRSRSREKSKDKSSKETRSKSEEKSSNSSTGQDQTKEKTEEPEGSKEPEKTEEPKEPEKKVKPEEPDTETKSAGEHEHDSNKAPDAADEKQMGDEAKFAADNSDIQGMKVIVEDKLEGVDAKRLEEKNQEEANHPEEKADSVEREMAMSIDSDDQREEEEMVMDEVADEKENIETEEIEERSGLRNEEEREESASTADEEFGFPVDLENCITLDEVGCEDEGEAVQDQGKSSESSSVIFFSTMPQNYTDMEFIEVMRGFGEVVRYLLVQDRQQGFIEMSTPSEAQSAVQVLDSEPVYINGTRLIGCLSQEYSRLTDGLPVLSDKEKKSDGNGVGTRKSERLDMSSNNETLDMETETTTDEKTGSETTPELETPETIEEEKTNETSEMETPEKIHEKETSESTPARKTRSKKTPQTKTSNRKTRSKKTLEKDSPEKPAEPEMPEESQETEADKMPEIKTDETPETKSDETPETNTDETAETKTDETPETKTSVKSSNRRTRSKNIPEKDHSSQAYSRRTRSKVTPEETTEMSENASEKSSDMKTVTETPATEVSEQIPEMDSSNKTSEEKEVVDISEKEPTGRTTVKGKSTSSKGPEERTDKRKGTPEDDVVPVKTVKTETPEDANQPNDGKEKSTGVSLETKTSEPEVKESEKLDHPEPPKQKSEMDQLPAPAEGAAEPEKPFKPVGSQFVRPVVGYFCYLCERIFMDEDEAKQDHCSTLEHYRKYQAKTGKDPWTS